MHAVRLVVEGRFGEMVCYQPPTFTSVPIIDAVNHLSQVEADGAAVQSDRALGISFGDRAADESPFSSSESPAETPLAEAPSTEALDAALAATDEVLAT